ncbi:MAG: bifunctional adenosylcobinamide kinase/adenosylcobinamide-phosphate guanylyltransferase [Eubacteriales bacterium]|nr:bifunctional adenosylcobinamide kinase/adenosylcobinamide-phosphate guanylyltransferase [Eubacteriales bacterium]
MLYLITGGSGSGKSEYAERAAVRMQERFGGGLYYVATMKPYDEECLARVARHRDMRKGKGFSTLECPVCLESVKVSGKDVLLLEDLSNLLANERYAQEGRIKGSGDVMFEQAKEAIAEPIVDLSRLGGCVVVVTNEVFSDGAAYEEETENYCRLLGFLNGRLAAAADGVAEVVCSIPVCQKGELPC